jgi:small subunit ribosomal protein S21
MAVVASIVVEPGEGVESLLRRFKKATQKAGVLQCFRARETFIPRSERRRHKSHKAQRRANR